MINYISPEIAECINRGISTDAKVVMFLFFGMFISVATIIFLDRKK